MKRKPNSGNRTESKVRPDKRFRHGCYSKAVKRYRKLDRDVRNCDAPTPEMLDLLGMALVPALHMISEATDVRDPESWGRYQQFVKTDVIRTMKILQEESTKNFRILKARHY